LKGLKSAHSRIWGEGRYFEGLSPSDGGSPATKLN